MRRSVGSSGMSNAGGESGRYMRCGVCGALLLWDLAEATTVSGEREGGELSGVRMGAMIFAMGLRGVV